jgi:hypothetical protein
MAVATARAGARNGSGAAVPPLPPVSVARFEEAQHLLERIVAENTDTFIAAGQAYRAQHREGTGRPLNAQEIAVIAAGLGVSLKDANEQVTEAGLTHHDQPEPQELLLAAGVATARKFTEAVRQFVALMELPDDIFEEACESGTLDEVVLDAAAELRKADLKEDARPRATRAMEHLADAAGVAPGKAKALLTGPVMQALWQAMTHLTSETASASSISSAASTAGTDGRSSTGPPTGTPST